MKTILALLLFACSFALSAQQVSDFYDFEDHRQAQVELKKLSEQFDTPYPEAAVPAYLTVLKYQRRRSDPDSILPAAQSLLRAAPEGSRAALTALYWVGESQANLYQHQNFLSSLERMRSLKSQTPQELQPLLELYHLLLRAKQEAYFGENYEKRSIYLSNALEIVAQEPSLKPSLMIRLSYSFSNMGQYPQAYDLLKRYQALVKPTLIDELDKMIYDLEIGGLTYSLERFKRLRNMQEKAIRKIKPYAADLPYLTAQTYSLASSAQYQIKRNEHCRQLQEKALQYKSTLEFQHGYLSILYHLGDYDAVLTVCQKILKDNIVNFHPATVYENPRADAQLLSGPLINNVLMWKSRTLYKKSIGEDHDNAVRLLHYSLEAGEVGRKMNNENLFGADGYAMSQLIINRDNSYVLGYQMRAAYQLAERTKDKKDLKQLFRYMEMRKNFLLSDAFSSDYLPESARKRRQKSVRSFEKSEYDFWLGNQDSLGSYVRNMLVKSNELDHTIEAINRQYPRPFNEHSQLEYADPDEIQANLDDKTVFIQYASQWQHSYVYVITNDKQFALKCHDGFDLGGKLETLTKLTSSPLQVQNFKREKFIELSHWVYSKLLQPLEQELAGKEKLIIVPERNMCLLPFELLLKSNEKKSYADLDYLVKNYEISYHYSGTIFDRLSKRESIKDGSFLGFAPVFSEGEAVASVNRSINLFSDKNFKSIKRDGFVPLPGTEAEINLIAGMFPKSSNQKLLLNKDATGQNLETELGKPYQYVHIATHGLLNYYDPRLSAFACYSADGKSGDFFFSHRVEGIKLRADLAALSSCESGLGRIAEGENLIALSRSFLVAGAKNILYSLWKIDDENSSRLMVDFYRSHLDGQSYGAALRTAKLKMLADPATAPPRFWAPFVLMGR